MKPFQNTCTSTYRVCTSTCLYENPVLTCTVYVRVHDSCTGMYMVCTLHYFAIQVCISMYLPRTGQFFRGMMLSPSHEMLQNTFQWHITAYLSVQFQKIQCSLVAQYTWSILGMYRVHTRDILVLTGTNMYRTVANTLHFQSS